VASKKRCHEDGRPQDGSDLSSLCDVLNCGEGVAGHFPLVAGRERGQVDGLCRQLLFDQAQPRLAAVGHRAGRRNCRHARRPAFPPIPARSIWRWPKTLAAQLEQLGVKPWDIKYVAVSHSHPDHIGNVAMFPQSMLLVQRAEYEWPALGGPRFKPELPVTKLEGDHDDSATAASPFSRRPATRLSSVAAGQAAEDRRAAALGRRRPLQGELGQSPCSGDQQ
jgi:N-acyl homoserine lactone hydrolase